MEKVKEGLEKLKHKIVYHHEHACMHVRMYVCMYVNCMYDTINLKSLAENLKRW